MRGLILVPRVPVACGWADDRYFISYLKKPDNDVKWHGGKVEAGDDSDWVGAPPSA
jgi:hypothetical protein